jgi:long-chain acyl-CoA synthetase
VTTDRPVPWWESGAPLKRFVCDLLASEIARLRPGSTPPPLPWPAHTRLEADLGADSLERLALATALSEAVHLHRSGIDDSLLTKPTIGAWTATIAESLGRFSARLTFKTSGSTGMPKWCVHDLADLEAEIAAFAAVLSGRQRILALVPSHHIYGFLFTVLLPARCAAPVLDLRAHAPARLAGIAQDGDLIVGYPDFWRAYARSVPQSPAGVTGLSSTAPLPAELANALRAAGLARLVEVYGSSETAGIGWRDDPAQPYELLPFWRRGDRERELLRRFDGGERTVEAPDHLVWDDPRHVRPAGRGEGAVQVGGINVFPERVAALLTTHPHVARATVRLMRPDEGQRLKAFVVPQRADVDAATLVAELGPWLDARLTAPERPKSIVVGPELPAGELGKSADWTIPWTTTPLPDRSGLT